MEIITASYKRIALIECSCCREDHTITLTKEDDDDLWFEFKNVQSPLFWRIGEYFRVKKLIKETPSHCENVVLLNVNQVLKLDEILSKEGYHVFNTPFYSEEVYANTDEDIESFEIGFRPEWHKDKPKLWKYVTGEGTVVLNKHQVECLRYKMSLYLQFMEDKLRKEQNDR